MSGTAIAFMVLICGLVWGGFVYLAIRAIHSERKHRNKRNGRREATG